MFHFGFSYVGLVFLCMLLIPNFIWTKKKPFGYEEASLKENKFLLVLERIGEVLVSVLLLIFKDFNIDLNRRSALPLLALARQYYEKINAPRKDFFEVKGCGHTSQGDKPLEVAKIIKDIGL
ncbi:MAG: hypothetical protein II030_09930 [Treponema sp.]|nr:hypothetical protein [Treponema sp.]